MNFDFSYFFFELIILWLPLSVALMICQEMEMPWGYTALILLVVYLLIVMLNRKNKYLHVLFHREKQAGNEFKEAVLFLIAIIISLLVVIHWINNITVGIILLMLLGVFFSSLVIEPRPKY